MSRVGEVLGDPKDPANLAELVTRIQKVTDSAIEFGNSTDPAGSTTLAGAGTPTTHNGQLMNIKGSWVEVEFETLDTAVDCAHNLNVPVFNSEVNVRWIVMGIRHSGVGVLTGAETISVIREHGGADTLSENVIALRAYAAAARTVNAANPIRVSLFFVPAVRWPD